MIRIQKRLRVVLDGQFLPTTQDVILANQCLGDVLTLLGAAAWSVHIDGLGAEADYYDLSYRTTLEAVLLGAGLSLSSPEGRVAATVASDRNVYTIPASLPTTIAYETVNGDVAVWRVGDDKLNDTYAGETKMPEDLLSPSVAKEIYREDTCFVIVYHADPSDSTFMTYGLSPTGAKTTICMTNLTTLFHELMHVYQGITGDLNIFSEVNARMLENEYRVQSGLIKRFVEADVPVHRGVASMCRTPLAVADDPVPPRTYSWCLIVSACAMPGDEWMLSLLRTIRETKFRSSDCGMEIFDVLLWEYYAVSPQISEALRRDTSVRARIRRFVVLPYLRLLRSIVDGSRLDLNCLAGVDGVDVSVVVTENRICGIDVPLSLSVLHWGVIKPIAILHEVATLLRSGVAYEAAMDRLALLVRKWKFDFPIVPAFCSMGGERFARDPAIVAFCADDVELLDHLRTSVDVGAAAIGVASRPRADIEVLSALVHHNAAVMVLDLTLQNRGERWVYVLRAIARADSRLVVGVHAHSGEIASLSDRDLVSIAPGATVSLSLEMDGANIAGEPSYVEVDWLDYPFYHVISGSGAVRLRPSAIAGLARVDLR